MGLISILGSIVSIVGKVVGVAGSIFKVARPIVEALRPAVDEIDTAMDWLEENAGEIGTGADDFLDANLKTLTDLEAVSGRGVVVFGKINELTAAMRVASQEKTPDTITEAEAAHFISLMGEIREALVPWKAELDASLGSLQIAEKSMS